MGVFFCLPLVLPSLFDTASELSLPMFAVRLYELMQIVLSSVVDDQDITRVEELGAWLLAKVPVVFPDFGNKPKFHYGLAHIGLSLRRHGPTPYWSSFAFESRLGELKRACLLVSNNHGVAHRGASLIGVGDEPVGSRGGSSCGVLRAASV